MKANEVRWSCDKCGAEGWIPEPRFGCEALAAAQTQHTEHAKWIRIGERRPVVK